MRKITKAFLVLLCIALAAALVYGCRTPLNSTVSPSPTAIMVQEEATNAEKAPTVTAEISEIEKHGNVNLSVSFDDMRAANMDISDIITVTVGNNSYDMPIGTLHTDVDNGDMVCCFDQDEIIVKLIINYGSFAEETGIATKETISEDPGYSWTVNIPSVNLCLKEKQGYADGYSAHQLTYTNNRDDYPNLSDEEFANFRCISVNGIKPNTVYRSSSPLNPATNRNSYCMAAMEKAGIKSVVNLADSREEMEAFEIFPGSYYSTCTILNEQMGYDFSTPEFKDNVRECILFINNNEGPYLIHCREGKDRTGGLCALLECYAGTSYDEILNDYMITYLNYYGAEPGSETYITIQHSIFDEILTTILGVSNPETADLQSAAKEVLLSNGLTEEDLAALQAKIMS